MKKTYFPPSILVLASQGFVGPNIGSGDDDAELQPEENDDNGSTQSAKWSNSFFFLCMVNHMQAYFDYLLWC